MFPSIMPFAAWTATAVTGRALTGWCPQHHCSICPWSFFMLLDHGPFTPAFLLWKWCTCSSPNFYTSYNVNFSLSNQLSLHKSRSVDHIHGKQINLQERNFRWLQMTGGQTIIKLDIWGIILNGTNFINSSTDLWSDADVYWCHFLPWQDDMDE